MCSYPKIRLSFEQTCPLKFEVKISYQRGCTASLSCTIPSDSARFCAGVFTLPNLYPLGTPYMINHVQRGQLWVNESRVIGSHVLVVDTRAPRKREIGRKQVRKKICESSRETSVMGLALKVYTVNKTRRIEAECKNMMVRVSALSAATLTYLFSLPAVGFVSPSTKQVGRDDLYKWFIFI